MLNYLGESWFTVAFEKEKSSSEDSKDNTSSSTENGAPKFPTNTEGKDIASAENEANERKVAILKKSRKGGKNWNNSADEARYSRFHELNVHAMNEYEPPPRVQFTPSVYFNVETNEICVRPTSAPETSSSAVREQALLTTVAVWRYVSLFMAIQTVVVEMLNGVVILATDFAGRNILMTIARFLTPVCVGVSLLIFWFEIIFCTFGGRLRDFGLKYSSSEYEHFTERDIFHYFIRAWKPISVILLALFVLLFDIIARLYLVISDFIQD